MNGAYEVGAVALKAQQRALETVANNVANLNTPAFKRADVRFAEVVSAPVDPVTETERLARAAAAVGSGVRMTPRTMVNELGAMQATGSPMDIAISGAGFIEVMGPNGESLLWRGGRLARDEDGYLAVEGGPALRALISIPDDISAIAIDREGNVSGSGNDGEPVELGQITLVRPGSDAGLLRAADGYYRVADGERTYDAIPGEDGVGTLEQGMIEGSNVDMTGAMVEMLVLQRSYAAAAQVVQAADQISSITNNLKR